MAFWCLVHDDIEGQFNSAIQVAAGELWISQAPFIIGCDVANNSELEPDGAKLNERDGRED